MAKYIMRRTTILCPDCMKGKLIHEKEKDLYCDQCGMQYIFVKDDGRTFEYKNK